MKAAKDWDHEGSVRGITVNERVAGIRDVQIDALHHAVLLVCIFCRQDAASGTSTRRTAGSSRYKIHVETGLPPKVCRASSILAEIERLAVAGIAAG